MTINGPHQRAPHAMQPQANAPQQQSGAHGAMTALPGAPMRGAQPTRQSSGAPVAMQMQR